MSQEKENPLRAEKRRKLHELREKLREKNLTPFPYTFDRTLHSLEAKNKASSLQNGEKIENEKHKMAGRVLTKRLMGKAAFFTFQDQEGTFQAYVRVPDS